MGAPAFLDSTRRPDTWSLCSWVRRMADSWWGFTPNSASPAVMRLAEMPASSRMWVSPQETRAALPSEPLARVVKVSK